MTYWLEEDEKLLLAHVAGSEGPGRVFRSTTGKDWDLSPGWPCSRRGCKRAGGCAGHWVRVDELLASLERRGLVEFIPLDVYQPSNLRGWWLLSSDGCSSLAEAGRADLAEEHARRSAGIRNHHPTIDTRYRW